MFVHRGRPPGPLLLDVPRATLRLDGRGTDVPLCLQALLDGLAPFGLQRLLLPDIRVRGKGNNHSRGCPTRSLAEHQFGPESQLREERVSGTQRRNPVSEFRD
jgi:hypothetical protein